METLQIFQAIGIFAIFAACVALMMARKLPTILALPVMAVGIALVAGIPFISSDAEQFTVAKDVLEAGAMRMSTAIAGLIFGGFFGKVLTKVGVTHTIIRKAAELAGDKPLPIALAFLVVASLIFASSNGLGMVILVGTIIIPIMISAGVSPMTAGAVLLFANGIGVTFSVGTLGVYIDTLGLPLETVTSYSWLCGIPLIIVAVAWIVCSVKGGKVRKAWAMPAGEPAAEKNVRSIALISPLIPIVLVFVLKMELVPSIIIGILITLILSTPKNPVQVVAGAFGGIRHEPCCSNGGAPSGFQCAGGLRSDKLSQCVGIRLYEGRCKRVSEKDDSLDYGLHTGGADRCQFCHYAVDKADMVLIWGKKIQRKGRQRFFPRNVCGPDGRVNLFVRA
jgi:Na+/H+ antiporter NhaC